MTTTSCYQNLNLPEGASISEIKSAFRHLAKAHHPDAAGQTSQDVDKFIKAQTAYQNLLKKAVAHNQAQQAETTTSTDTIGPNWCFTSIKEVGLDVHYRLEVLKSTNGSFKLVLPWQVREACPRCLGLGQTLGRVGQGSLYRPHTCSKCEGRGFISRKTRMEITINPEMVGQDKIRLKKAGLYNPKDAKRGDLILDITWVDQLA